MTGGWGEDLEATIKRLYIIEGKSGAEVEALLGNGLSRVAIVAGANRRALKDPSWRKPRGTTPRSRKVKSAPPAPSPPPAEVETVEGKRIYELEDNDCVWPVGSDASPATRLYCGASKPRRNTYCPAHERVAYPNKKGVQP